MNKIIHESILGLALSQAWPPTGLEFPQVRISHRPSTTQVCTSMGLALPWAWHSHRPGATQVQNFYRPGTLIGLASHRSRTSTGPELPEAWHSYGLGTPKGKCTFMLGKVYLI